MSSHGRFGSAEVVSFFFACAAVGNNARAVDVDGEVSSVWVGTPASFA